VGHRNPDRISIVERRSAGETVSLMISHRWKVVAKCFACRLEIEVGLPRIVRERGPETSLWDRDAVCGSRSCKGRMEFMARTGHGPVRSARRRAAAARAGMAARLRGGMMSASPDDEITIRTSEAEIPQVRIRD
jgi:hypothetical protein